MMDVHDLSAMLHMQNQTQHLLQQLQQKQSQCRRFLDTSLSSMSSNGLDISSTHRNKSPHQSHPQCVNGVDIQGQSQASENHLSRSAPASKIRKQEILNHLEGWSKLDSYHKVSSGDIPGRRSEAKLAQGIENNRFQFGDSSPRSKWSTSANGFDDHAAEVQPKWDGYDYSLEAQKSSREQEDRANTSVTFQDELQLLGSSEEYKPSTPTKYTRSLLDTPRSILKHRKIIDDNIHVESKYSHTPISLVTPRGKHGLNYSYSDLGDLAAETSELSGCDNGSMPHYSDATDGSYIEEYLDDSPATSKTKMSQSYPTNTDESALEDLIRDRLLLDAGNDRKNASIVKDLSQRPKRFVIASDSGDVEPIPDATNKKRTAIKSPKPKLSPKNRLSKSRTSPRVRDISHTSKLWQSRDKPLLGYDWIAGNLENEDSLLEQPDEYFRELQKFRNKHKLACAGDAIMSTKLDLSRPISPEINDPGHKCLHGFTVNERLFTEPMNADDQGKSMCPVCLSSREEPTQLSPGFVRVSIPRSTLDKPYRVKPHRRRSFDATDSYALSQHCLAGYQCSLPTSIPTAKNIDIKGANGIRGQQAMTLKEAEDFVKSHSRKSRLMATHPSKLPLAQACEQSTMMSSMMTGSDITSDSFTRGKDISTRSITRGSTTDSLLNTSRNLRYDLQDLAKRRGRDKHKIPHSTNYPVL